jgi:glycosyltransferase involved in cell wall biosynthesis
MIVATGFSELLPVKNISAVIEACIRGGVTLWVVGDGGEIDRLREIAGQKVKFWGRVSNEKARGIMRKSGIFVLFSSHEGMPHAVLEALAEKVPVILSDIPAHREIVANMKSGILVEAGDVSKLALAIKRLATNTKLRQKLAENGYLVFRQKFTWEVHLKQLYNVFDDLVSSGGRSS